MLVLRRSAGQSLAIGEAARLTVVRIGADDADLRIDGARAKRVGDPAPRRMKPGTTFAMQRHDQLRVAIDENEREPIRIVLIEVRADRVRLGVEAPVGTLLARVD